MNNGRSCRRSSPAKSGENVQHDTRTGDPYPEKLPRGEVFDWVDRVSIELTTQMLSTLFDFPFEDWRTLTGWSNVATVNTRAGTEIDLEEKRDAILQEMLRYFAKVWKIRQKQPPKSDLISMLAHGEATHDLPSRPQEFMGNLLRCTSRSHWARSAASHLCRFNGPPPANR
jgi:cytochrome P450